MSRLVPLAAVSVLLALAACSPESDSGAPGSEPVAAVRGGSAPADGGSSVVYENGRVTLESRGALLAAVLEKLGRQADFSLQGKLPGRTLEARLKDVALVEALSTLLAEEAWSLEYAPQPEGGHRLVRLHIGGGAPQRVERLRERTGGTQQGGPGRGMSLREPSPERRADMDAMRAERQPPWDPEEYERELVQRLESTDPEVRAEAVGELYAEGDQLQRLIAFAHDDPAVEVRLAAIEELEGEATWAVLNAMIVALDDPEPRVVLRSVEAISYLDDATLAPKLEPLLEHPDPEVREAAVETIAELTE